MGDAKLKNSLSALVVPEGDADALLSAGDGDAALLYLYLMRRGGAIDVERAARELGRSDRDMSMAADRLRALGLLSGAAETRRVLAPDNDPPEYDAGEIARRSMEDGVFRALVQEVQLALGRNLSRPDINRLFAIYSDMALPPEVIVLLVQYCKDESLRLYGPGRTVGLAFIYRVAQEWFDREIMTYELAESWLRTREERRSVYGRLRQHLGYTERDLSKAERAYVDAWLETGFPPESVMIAADRTIARTGGMKWKYADAILRDWHEKGFHTPEEIETGDGLTQKKTKKTSAPAGERDDSEALAQIRRMREKLRNS